MAGTRTGSAADKSLPPLLSEFSQTPLAGFFSTPRWSPFLNVPGWAIRVALALLVFAVVVLIVSRIAHVDVLAVVLTGTMTASDGSEHTVSARQEFGYLLEGTHGVYYLICAPLLVVVFGRFVQYATRATGDLHADGSLSTPNGLPPDDALRGLNLSVMKWAWPGLILLASYGFVNEGRNLGANLRGERHDLGYIQAPCLGAWVQWFNAPLSSEPERLHVARRLRVEHELRDALHAVVSNNPTLFHNWGPALDGVLPDAPLEDQITSIKASKTIDMARVAGDMRLLKLTVKAERDGTDVGPISDGVPPPSLYWCFFIVALLMEGLFQAFAAWTVLKIAIWVWFVLDGISNRRRRVRLTPMWLDPSKSFGFSALNPTYNAVVGLAFLACFTVLLNMLSNVDKGTWVFDRANTPVYLGQFLILLIPLVVFCVIALGPVVYFGSVLERGRSEVKHKLLRALSAARQAAKNPEREQVAVGLQRTIQADLDLLEAQCTWPRHDSAFLWLVCGSGSILFLCILLNFGLHVPDKIRPFLDATDTMKFLASGVRWLMDQCCS